MRQFTTYHEAAHAVMALALGWTVHHVVIDDFQSGMTCSDPPTGERDWREHCMVLLAGSVAEGRLGVPFSPAANDEEAEALHLIRQSTDDDEVVQMNQLRSRIDDSLNSNWPLVVKIGDYLIDHDLFPRWMLVALDGDVRR